MKKNMKQTMRILTLLALALFSSGRIWAASVVSMDVTGGQLKFFSDEACTTSISEAEAGSTVYIKAIPDYGYTGNGATFAAVASVGSNQAESRRAVHVDETLPFGGAVEVSVVDNTRGIYSLTMPDDTGVAVSATLATVKAATVSYVDENYKTYTVNAVPLDLTMTVLAADQWYFVGSDITFDQGFTNKDDELMRNKCIVVADGATFTIGTKDAPLENYAFSFGGNLFLYGQEKATGKLSINSELYGINIGGCFVIANLDVDVTSKSIALSGSYNNTNSYDGSFIAGHPTKGNTVTVRNNNGNGISAAGKPLVIKNCNVDVDSKEGWGINAGGVSLTIEGLAKGTSSVKVRSAGSGINVGGNNVTATIKYCNIDIVSDNGHGIYGGGISVIIEGIADGTNSVKVRSKSDGILGGGTPVAKPVTIKYCDVDVVSTDGYGISANYPGLTIEGVATGTANKISVCGSKYGISASGGSVNIKYCDVNVVSTGSYGIRANSPGVMTIEGRSDGSNDVTVRSAGYGIYGYGSAITILNCDVEVTGATQDETGEYGFCGSSGIYDSGGSGMSIIGSASGNTVVVHSNSNGIEGGGCPVTIQDCTVDVIAKGQYGIYSSSGITISGSQVDVSAQEGSWGIGVADNRYTTLGWTHATDYVNVSSYTGPVKVAEGQTFTDGNSLYGGVLSDEEKAAIGGKKLTPGVGVTFAAAGYATYYDSEYDLVLPAGMQARVVTDEGADKGTLKYETIADGDSEQNVVPAGTAVMLKVAAADEEHDEEQTLALTIGSGAEAYSGDNLLSGSDTDTEIPTATGSAFYKLTYGGEDNTTFGWYWGGDKGQSFTSAAHRAWLTLPASVDARFLGLPEGEATGITQQTQSRQSAWYTMDGVKLSGQPTAKGIYIKDGKKVINK